MRDTNPEIRGSFVTLSRVNKEINHTRHIIVKQVKNKDKKKAVRNKRHTIFKQ